jgi:hypothetical protein
MLRSELEESANWMIMKFVGVSAAMSVLASCAVAMPLRPLATSPHGRGEGDLTCTADSRCSKSNSDRQAAYRRLQPVVGGKIDDDPPDFILNSGDKERTVR